MKTEFNVPDGFVLVPKEAYRALVNAAQEPSSSYSIKPNVYVARDNLNRYLGIYTEEGAALFVANQCPGASITPLFDLSDNCLGNLLRAASRQVDLARTHHIICDPLNRHREVGIKECEDVLFKIDKLLDLHDKYSQWKVNK